MELSWVGDEDGRDAAGAGVLIGLQCARGSLLECHAGDLVGCLSFLDSLPHAQHRVKLVLTFAGKSSISLRLVRCKWTHEYDPTIQDFYSVTRVVDGRTYQLNLTDTAGQEEFVLHA